MRRRRAFANLCLAAVGLAAFTAACSSADLSSNPPSALQQAVMARYTLQNFVDFDLGTGAVDVTNHVGCAISPMATARRRGGVLIVYAQAFCQRCPPSDASEVLPVVAHFDGTRLVSEGAATAEGDPEFQNQIDKLFPKSLWAEAADQGSDLPNLRALKTAADEEAGCR